MFNERLLVMMAGYSMLLPVVLYWIVQIREISKLSKMTDLFSVKSLLLGAFFPWGLLITGILMPLCIGILGFYEWARICAIIVAFVFAFIWSYGVMSLGQGHWSVADVYFMLHCIFIVVVLNLPMVSNQFK